MRKSFIAFTLLFISSYVAVAQEQNTWTLQRSVEYAVRHNISVQQSVLNQRLAALQLKQSQLSQIPSVNTSGAYGRSYGRSIDPTSNAFVQQSYDFVSVAGNADVLLFGWFQRRNTITANKFNLQAAAADLDQTADNVSLNVATGFLRLLLAREQINISEKQIALSAAQLRQTRSFAEVGRVAEIDVAQLESQIATDSANLISAISDYTSAILDMKALLNFDFEEEYIPVAPDISVEEEINFLAYSPEAIYQQARTHLGTIRSNELRVKASRKNLAAARGARWPQLGLGAQLGSNWASTYRELDGFTPTPAQPTGTYIDVNGIRYDVYQPSGIPIYRNVPLGEQLGNNFRQTVSLSLTIPLFNAWQAQYNVRQAQVNLQTQELNKEQAEVTLKQDVYKAHNDARNSYQSYLAARRAVQASQRAYDFAQKRYEVGLTNIVEYLTTQNALYNAESRLNSAKYDLIFKLKVIDYYLGKELKL